MFFSVDMKKAGRFFSLNLSLFSKSSKKKDGRKGERNIGKGDKGEISKREGQIHLFFNQQKM